MTPYLADLLLADVGQLHPLELLRANSVQRFAMTPMTREQTIAAHQWDVAVLFISQSHHVWDKGNTCLSTSSSWIAAGLMYAMFHDIGEVFTGDLPSPAKTAYTLEANSRLPDWFQRIAMAWKKTDFRERDVLIMHTVKCCDLLSTWHWAHHFGNQGDGYTQKMVRNLTSETFNHLSHVAALFRQYGYKVSAQWFDIIQQLEEQDGVRTVYDLENL